MKVRQVITLIGIILFVAFIIYEAPRVPEYVPDTMFFIVLAIILFLVYEKLDLDLASYSLALLGLLLHNAGAFGWCNISPLPIQWDHITHVVGIAAATLLLFRSCRRFLTANKHHNRFLFLVILLASLGIGVIIEFYEFAGYFIVGEGAGGLGQGEGDIATELGDSLWLNTMLDMVYNLLGAFIGLGMGYALRYHQKR